MSEPRIRSLPVRLGLAILGYLVVNALASAVTLAFVYVTKNMDPSDPESLRGLPQPTPETVDALLDDPLARLGVWFVSSLAALAFVLVLVLVLDRRRPAGLEDGRGGRRMALGWGLLLGGVLAAVAVLAISAMGGRHLRPEGFEGLAVGWVPALAVTLVLLAAAEISFVHGYLFVNLREATSPVRAILFSAFLYTAVHGSGPGFSALGWANTLLFGLSLGMLRQLTGGLALPVGVAAGWTLVLGMVLGGRIGGVEVPSAFRVSLEDLAPALGGGEYGPEASALVTTLLVAAVFVLARPLMPPREEP